MFKVYQFYWRGINRFQQKQSGKCLAQNREQLENKLLAQGYHHIRISRNLTLSPSPKQNEITQIIQQLALLLTATIPLKQSLMMVVENCENIQLYRWLNTLISTLEKGFSFSSAIAQQGKYLSLQEIQLIKMAEQSGNLPTILKKMAQSRLKSEKLMQRIKKILFYPVFILSISITLSILLLLFIVPQFIELYGEKSTDLPFITKLLFSISEKLLHHFTLFSFILLILTFIAFFLAKKTNMIKQLTFKILLHLPIFNQIIRYARIIFFSQHSALMLNASIRLDTILHSFLLNKQSDPILHQAIKHCLTQLKQGYKLAESLDPYAFNNEVIQMISIGEKSGKLSIMLEHISDNYQQKLDYKIDILSQLLEPLLMLIIGLIVGIILIGLYLPIFDMGAIAE